jgi:hypothetical protein
MAIVELSASFGRFYCPLVTGEVYDRRIVHRVVVNVGDYGEDADRITHPIPAPDIADRGAYHYVFRRTGGNQYLGSIG